MYSSNTKTVTFNDDKNVEDHNFISAKIKYIDNDDDFISNLNCTICMCPCINPVLCPNEHMFCHECIRKNYEYRKKCPQCNLRQVSPLILMPLDLFRICWIN
jgi:hypothetical protein